MKKLPIGLSDFKEIREEDYYYIDKTLLIDELKRTNGKVLLITRPRRFGKTLNLSMLKYFYEATQESNSHLFESTDIFKHETYRELQGSYPVIFLTFKEIKQKDWEAAYNGMVFTIAQEFKRHQGDVFDILSEYEKKDYEAIVSRTADSILYGNSLFFLTKILHQRYAKRVMIFIDEYDAPLHTSYAHGYYDKTIEFIRSFLSAGLKDNSYLERGYLSGILRAGKEGIFSGLNNLRVFTVLDTKFSDKFGFTKDEVVRLLDDYGLQDHYHQIRQWYDGYHAGLCNDLYNPWSLMECVDNNGEILSYWANTSDNQLVKKLIARAGVDAKSEFEDMLAGRFVLKEIKDMVTLPGIENDSKALWSLLLFTGYVTFQKLRIKEGKKWGELIVPNKEITVLFQELMRSIVEQSLSPSKIQALKEVIQTGNDAQFSDLLQDFVANSMSVFDISSDEPEKSYHLFILGLLVLLSYEYQVKSNRESGYGRYDIMLIPKDRKRSGIVIEFKKVSNTRKETLEKAADNALTQIAQKEYAKELSDQGINGCIAYGIAFQGKRVYVISQSAN